MFNASLFTTFTFITGIRHNYRWRKAPALGKTLRRRRVTEKWSWCGHFTDARVHEYIDSKMTALNAPSKGIEIIDEHAMQSQRTVYGHLIEVLITVLKYQEKSIDFHHSTQYSNILKEIPMFI